MPMLETPDELAEVLFDLVRRDPTNADYRVHWVKEMTVRIQGSVKNEEIIAGKPEPGFTDVTEVVMGVVESRRKAFTSYMVNRLNMTALDSDPLLINLDELLTELKVPLDMRRAKQELYDAMPELAWLVEVLLTGEPWDESMTQSGKG